MDTTTVIAWIGAITGGGRERALDGNAACSPFLFLSERGPMTRQAFNYLVGETAREPNSKTVLEDARGRYGHYGFYGQQQTKKRRPSLAFAGG